MKPNRILTRWHFPLKLPAVKTDRALLWLIVWLQLLIFAISCLVLSTLNHCQVTYYEKDTANPSVDTRPAGSR